MTMQQPPNNVVPIPTRSVPLPEPRFPMLTRMISNAFFPFLDTQTQSGRLVTCPHCKASVPVPADKEEPITWTVGQPHPLVSDMKVMRMFIDRGGVEVYSVSGDGRTGVRNLVPMSMIRLIEEAMPLEVFIEELDAAENDEPEPNEPEPEPEPAPPPVSTNNNQPPLQS